MEPPIRNKPPIWNTFAADRVIFRIGVFTVLCTAVRSTFVLVPGIPFIPVYSRPPTRTLQKKILPEKSYKI